jgi:hypothetical protein
MHALFDAYFISIEPGALKVQLSVGLRDDDYKPINGRELRLPENIASRPKYEALSRHYREWLILRFRDLSAIHPARPYNPLPIDDRPDPVLRASHRA